MNTSENNTVSTTGNGSAVNSAASSLRPASRWSKLSELANSGATVTVNVKSLTTNRDGKTVGLNTELEGQRAFLPGSQMPRGVRFESLVGTTLEVKIIECDPKARPAKLVVSRTAQLKTEVDSFISTLVMGAEVEGEVVSVVENLGYFVRIGAVDALLHVTQTPLEGGAPKVFNVGDSVKAKISAIDTEKGKVGLTMRAPRPERRDRRDDNPARNSGNGNGNGGKRFSEPKVETPAPARFEAPRRAVKPKLVATAATQPVRPVVAKSSQRKRDGFTQQFGSFAELAAFFGSPRASDGGGSN